MCERVVVWGLKDLEDILRWDGALWAMRSRRNG